MLTSSKHAFAPLLRSNIYMIIVTEIRPRPSKNHLDIIGCHKARDAIFTTNVFHCQMECRLFLTIIISWSVYHKTVTIKSCFMFINVMYNLLQYSTSDILLNLYDCYNWLDVINAAMWGIMLWRPIYPFRSSNIFLQCIDYTLCLI